MTRFSCWNHPHTPPIFPLADAPLASFRWNEDTFGPHFTVSPLEGMIAPLTEAGIEVVFAPEGVDDDIRQEGVLCMIEV